MNEHATAATEPATRKASRPLWPWVAGTLLICLFSVGWSVWRPVVQAHEVLQFAEDNDGVVRLSFDHPAWLGRFVDDNYYLPHYDTVKRYALIDVPVTDEHIRTLRQLRDLRKIELDVSRCTPQGFDDLGRLQSLERIELHGDGHPIPLDWVQQLPNLRFLRLNSIPVAHRDLPNLFAMPGLSNGYQFAETTQLNHGHPAAACLLLSADRLEPETARALVGIPHLCEVELVFGSSSPEFWSVLSRHPHLEQISLECTSPEGRLSGSELAHLQRIASLKQLQFNEVPETRQNDLFHSSAWQDFREQRPDVQILVGDRIIRNE